MKYEKIILVGTSIIIGLAVIGLIEFIKTILETF